MMKQTSIFLMLSCGVFLSAGAAYAERPICHDFTSQIEPDMQRQETDFTHERYTAARNTMQTTIREWMENKFERNKKYPTSNSKLFDGEIWLAQANHDAMIKGYVLKLEYLAAASETKENARIAFCEFLTETPYFD